MRETKPIAVEDAVIMFRNFSGAEGKFNPKGRRNFCVFLDTPEANELADEGWNIKWLDPRDPEDSPQAYLQVSVAFSNIPPKVVMITGQGQTVLTEDTIELLDWADILTADVVINPYNWEVNGKVGIKAYLKSMYVTIQEDEFASKYYTEEDEETGSVINLADIDDLPF